jgi:hypothetical protein
MTTGLLWSTAKAGIIVDLNTVANKGQLPKLITEECYAIIKRLDISLFESEELREDMYMSLAGGMMDKYGSKNMWKYWQEMKSDMQKIFTNLPMTYHKMKSGTQLYQVFNTLIRDHWKNDYVICAVCCTARFIDSQLAFVCCAATRCRGEVCRMSLNLRLKYWNSLFVN